MGLPAEGDVARMQSLDKENRALERKLADEREEKQNAIGYLVAFHDALRGINQDLKIQSGVTAAIQKVPGLSPFLTKQQEVKRQRDNELRHSALLRMSREEAVALELLDQWRGVHAIHELMQSDMTEEHRYGR